MSNQRELIDNPTSSVDELGQLVHGLQRVVLYELNALPGGAAADATAGQPSSVS